MSQLHVDILLNIFDNYNDIASRSSLNDLRSASQVCTAWRETLLESPLLWARLVNLDFLDKKTGNWKSEVLRRTGNVPLYIQCHRRSVSQSRSFLPFFESLLTDNWHRIRSLSLKLPYHFLLRGSILVTKLQEPAPLLKKLAVDVHREGSSVSQPHINQVVGLGEHAPLIRYLETPIFSMPLETPWLSGLRVLGAAYIWHRRGQYPPYPFRLVHTSVIPSRHLRPHRQPGIQCHQVWLSHQDIDWISIEGFWILEAHHEFYIPIRARNMSARRRWPETGQISDAFDIGENSQNQTVRYFIYYSSASRRGKLSDYLSGNGVYWDLRWYHDKYAWDAFGLSWLSSRFWEANQDFDSEATSTRLVCQSWTPQSICWSQDRLVGKQWVHMWRQKPIKDQF